jgi:hypothetical protein
MYLRATKRRNRDGSTVEYYALAENVWSPQTRRSETTVVHSFGRADQLDRAALERLVNSIRRVLVDDGIGQVAANGEPLHIADLLIERVQELGVTHVAKALWDRLGIGDVAP